MGPRTFETVKELFWHNCSPVCGSSAWWFYSGVNDNLLKEDYAAHCASQVCCNQNPCPQGRSLLTRASTGDTQSNAGLAQSLVGVIAPFPQSWCAQGFVCALRASLLGLRFNFKGNCVPPTVLLGILLCCWIQVSFFGGIQHFLVDGYSEASCHFGVLTGEEEHMSFYSTILHC